MTPAQIKAAREKLKLTQVQFALITRSDVRTVQRWEADPTKSSARPAPGPVLAILDALRRGVPSIRFREGFG